MPSLAQLVGTRAPRRGFRPLRVHTALRIVKGFGRWVLVVGLPGTGKSTLLNNFCRRFRDPLTFSIGFFDAWEFDERKARGKRVVIIEDLPQLVNDERKLRRLVGWISVARHVTQNLIVSTQTLSLFDSWLPEQFQLFILFRSDKKSLETIGLPDEIASEANELPRFQYFIFDREKQRLTRRYSNNQVKPVRNILS